MDLHEIDQIVKAPHSGNRHFDSRWGRYLERLLNVKPKGMLYHYTSVETVQKILINGEIRCFNPLASNDTAEIEDARQRILKFLANKKKRTTSRARKDVCEKVSQYVEKFEEYFVFCLSEDSSNAKGDKLEMWRAYGRDGDGAALGFNISKYSLIVGGHYDPDDLIVYRSYVFYDDKEKDDLIERIYDYFQDLRREFNIPYEKIIKPISHCFMLLLPLFKNSYFSSENEFRLVLIPSGQARFGLPTYQDSGRLNTYAPIELWSRDEIGGRFTPRTLHEVLIGPGLNRDLNYQSTKQVIRHSMVEIMAHKSDMPYRPKG